MSSKARSRAAGLVKSLEAVATEDRAANEKRYLKSPESFHHMGVTVPAIRKITKAFHKANKTLSRDELIALARELWAPEFHETRMMAIELLIAYKNLLTAADAALVEKMIDESHTWAYVDSLSAHVMGGLIGRFPELANVLDRWAKHENFWLRRAAMLSLLIPLRNGAGDFKRFSRYAESMLHEKEFFIRKAIGWILRDTSRIRPELVYNWLTTRAHLCSTLTVREATRHLPAEQADGLIAAAKTGQALQAV